MLRELGCLCISISMLGCSSGATDHNPRGQSAQGDPGSAGSAGATGGIVPNLGIAGASSGTAACSGGSKTTLSGSVFAPNGTLPLYNVTVYVPRGELMPLPSGMSCERCGELNGTPAIAAALSDAQGRFVLEDVPAGIDVPLVVQVGKWRRMVKIPEVRACVDNVLTDPNLTRLPRTRSEGNMPNIAITTGVSEAIACLLPKLGIAASEYGVPGQGKAVTFYAGGASRYYPYNPAEDLAKGPPGMQLAKVLWSDLNELKKYDMAIFSCEGGERRPGGPRDPQFGLADGPPTKFDESFAAVTDYLNAGGRIFTTDYHYTWYKLSPSPELRSAATIPGNGGSLKPHHTVTLDTSFPKGKALADWLAHVAPGGEYGKVSLAAVFDNLSAANPSATQVWGSSRSYRSDLSEDPATPPHPRLMTINTPVGISAKEQCGKAVHLDAHVIIPGAIHDRWTGSDNVGPTFPEACKAPFSKGQQLFAFFFFDLATCIQKEDAIPVPPAIVK